MRKIILFLLIIACIFSNMVVFAEEVIETEESETAETYTTGLVEMGEEELAEFKRNTPMIIDVKPNALYMERLNNEMNLAMAYSNGSDNVEVAPDGDEIVAAIVDESSVASVMMADETEELPIPSYVDNSEQNTFPKIDSQGGLGSCTGWSFGYYQLTNNANKIRGTSAKTGSSNNKANVYSPNWIYNLANGGIDEGLTMFDACTVLYNFGCPNIEKVPLLSAKEYEENYNNWFPGKSIWESALQNKCDIYYGSINPDDLVTPIVEPNSRNLDILKKILANGYVVSFSTKVNSKKYMRGRTSKNDYDFVWTEILKTYNNHALTIVGYDDGFWVDINGNGIQETAEYGAFKVANSWGEDEEYHNDGFIWLSYDSLNEISAVKESNPSDRISALTGGQVYYLIKPQKEYEPLITAKVKLDSETKGGLIVTLGIKDLDSQDIVEKSVDGLEYIKLYTEETYSLKNKDMAFCESGIVSSYTGFTGYKNSYPKGVFVFDMTSLLTEMELSEDNEYYVYIKLQDTQDGISSIVDFELTDHNTGQKTTYEGDDVSTNKSGNDDTIEVGVNYVSSIMTIKQDKQISLMFNNRLVSDTIKNSIFVYNGNEEQLNINTELDENQNTVSVLLEDGSYSNGFYTLKILPTLATQGRFAYNKELVKPFYVPYH